MLFGTTLPSCLVKLCRRAALWHLQWHLVLGQSRGTSPPNPRGAWREVNRGGEEVLFVGGVSMCTSITLASYRGIPLFKHLHATPNLPKCPPTTFPSLTDRTCSIMWECMWAARFSSASSSLPPTTPALFGEIALFVICAALRLRCCPCVCGLEVVCTTCLCSGSLQTGDGFVKTTFFQRIWMSWSRRCPDQGSVCVCVVCMIFPGCLCVGLLRPEQAFRRGTLLNFRWTAVSHYFHLPAGLPIFSFWAEALSFQSWVLGRVGCNPWAVVAYESKRVKGGRLRTVENK